MGHKGVTAIGSRRTELLAAESRSLPFSSSSSSDNLIQQNRQLCGQKLTKWQNPTRTHYHAKNVFSSRSVETGMTPFPS